ncbi:uncharacterized protein LOC135701000 isoform X2 [Ochlerotatus camptorhynchus]
MSSKGPKAKSSSNLRILWIPGRKKHNRKGVYNPTKGGLPQYLPNQQRKIESWTLGGTVNQTKIINAKFYFRDLHDNLDVGMATATGAMSLATMAANKTDEASSSKTSPVELNADGTASCSTGGTQVVELVVLNDLNGDISKKDIPSSNQFDTLELIDECEEKDRNYSNAESASSLLSSNNDSRSADYAHNSATLAIGEARRHRRRDSYNNSKKDSCENLDTIDHINDNDAVDAVKIISPADEPRLDAFRQQKKKKKMKNHSDSREDGELDDKDKEDKLVTCLYYSLVCWDCSIS